MTNADDVGKWLPIVMQQAARSVINGNSGEGTICGSNAFSNIAVCNAVAQSSQLERSCQGECNVLLSTNDNASMYLPIS